METAVPVITRESMRTALEEVVGERGRDFIYQAPLEEFAEGVFEHGQCLYRSDGKPSCLFGHALDRLGVPYNENWEYEEIGAVLRGLSVDDTLLQSACREAQEAQDEGRTWGHALDRFILRLRASEPRARRGHVLSV